MRRRRSRGSASVEYLIVLILIALAGVTVTMNYARTIRCKMTEAPGHAQECAGSGNVRLEASDDGCIGLVCKTP
jgi:hypothetical protein